MIVRLAETGLEDGELAALERRISRGLIACGCNEGAVLGLLYLVLVPILIVTGLLAPDSWLGWIALAIGFIVTMLVGKIVGLAVARTRLWRALAAAERALLAHPKSR